MKPVWSNERREDWVNWQGATQPPGPDPNSSEGILPL